MKKIATSYDAGWEYAAHQNDLELIDIDNAISGTYDIPIDDYRWLIDHEVEPNTREYWAGYNDYIVMKG